MTKISRRKALTLLSVTGAAVALAPTFVFAADKTLICNWNNAFPPYSMERDGRMTGILVDCIDELLGKRMGFTLDHKGHDWVEAQKLVQEGKGDTLCTNPTEARKQYIEFAEDPVVESLPSIFCAKNNPRINRINAIRTLTDLKEFRQVDYTGNGWAHETFPPDLNITYVETVEKAFEMIARGEADIFVGNGLAAMYTIKQTGLKDVIHARELQIGESSSFHFGLRRNYPEVEKIIADFTDVLDQAMIDGVTRKIILQYL